MDDIINEIYFSPAKSFYHTDYSEISPTSLAEEFRMRVVSNIDPELLGTTELDPRTHIGIEIKMRVQHFLGDNIKRLIMFELNDKIYDKP